MDLSTLRQSIAGLYSGAGGLLALLITVACVLAPPLRYLYRYRNAIRERVEEIEKKVSLVRIVRRKEASAGRRRVMCMELDPDFVERHPGWNMMSLGEYLSQLEPAAEGHRSAGLVSMLLRKELEVVVGKFLLDNLGRTYGAALLPALGAGSVAASMAKLSGGIAGFVARCILSDDGDADDVVDPASLDISLMELVSFINVHQKVARSPGDGALTPLEYLGRGEKAAGDLSYDTGDGTFPDVFNLGDFAEYVARMEERVRESEGAYDPYDRRLPPPRPINDRLLPGLHLGSGDLKCTHTRREGVRHRLMCVLLNKLCHNYFKLSRGDEPEGCFRVVCEGRECLFPEQLVECLMDTGHTVEVCPRLIVTNFGVSLCVKEDDGSFSPVPTTLMLRTGVERTSDGRPAYFATPHGGMDLNVSGPLLGDVEEDGPRASRRPAWMQFYVSIGGVTCFHPDEDADAPWRAKTSLADVYLRDDAVRAIRMCAIVAVAFNRIASELDLPFGGYGVLGMCNDSATLVDFALRGETSSYPLLSTGRYLNHIVSYLVRMRDELSARPVEGIDLGPVLKDVARLVRSTSRLPSDLHISPATLADTSARYGKTYDGAAFQSLVDGRAILQEMSDVAREYLK